MGLLDRLRSSSSLAPAAAAAGAADGSLLLVDVREKDEVREGRAKDARHIPLAQVPASFEALKVEARGRPVAFVCRSGMRSGAAVKAAQEAGLDARNVSGGMLAWQRAGLPVTKGRR